MARERLVIIDADTVAGWRRAEPSLSQLWDAVDDLVEDEPDLKIAVLADPALKWVLDVAEREIMERDIAEGRLVCAPGGSVVGHVGFLEEVVRRAEARGYSPVVVTDQQVPGARLSRVRREGTRWSFDLRGVEPKVVAPTRPDRRRRRRSAA